MKENITLGELIKEYRSNNNLSMDDFAAKSGLSKSYISILEKNKHPRTGNPITPTLETIYNTAKGMDSNVNDILDLIGDQVIKINTEEIKETRPLNNKEKEILEPFNKLNIDGKEKVIDYTYDLLESEKYIEEETITYIGKAAAGNGYNYLDNIEIEQTIAKKERPKHDFIIKVVGDSMEPKIPDGALAFVKINTDYVSGKIYVVDNDGSVYIKTVYFEDEKIVLRSINTKYDDIEISFSEGFRVLGEVVDWE